uniref:Nicotinamide/nicotinic acid mononucleotide adenylyltransferase 3 n=1 Tax=Arcella intermedia TaxID=1963864 RepID=A0A6B2LI27_9EUKA
MSKDYFDNSPNYKLLGSYFSPVNDGYKKKGLVAQEHRVKMLELATESSDHIMVDPWEARQPKWLETKQVLDHFLDELNKDLPKNYPRVVVKLLCGSDLLDSFNTPGLWSDSDVKDLCSYGIVCVTRAGTDVETVIWSNDLIYSQRSNLIILHQWVPNGVSSTLIRKALSRGLSIKYFVDDKVIDYIKQHNLYTLQSKL